MKCPTCHETLLLSEKQGDAIDYWPHCRGIWLDRGELEKILDQSATHYASKKNYEDDYKRYNYQDYDSAHHKHHPHKKKSFPDEFFDF